MSVGRTCHRLHSQRRRSLSSEDRDRGRVDTDTYDATSQRSTSEYERRDVPMPRKKRAPRRCPHEFVHADQRHPALLAPAIVSEKYGESSEERRTKR